MKTETARLANQIQIGDTEYMIFATVTVTSLGDQSSQAFIDQLLDTLKTALLEKLK